jgi:HK97 gp10 family phage protein
MTQSTHIEGMDEFIRDLNKLSVTARSARTMDALEAGGQIIVAYAQDNIRNKLNKHPTGFMVNNVGLRRNGKVVEAGVFGVIYAKIHEFGGIIKARSAKFLRFQVEGQWVMTKSVHMPARPYLRPAVDNHMPEIKDAIADGLRGLLIKAVGK